MRHLNPTCVPSVDACSAGAAVVQALRSPPLPRTHCAPEDPPGSGEAPAPSLHSPSLPVSKTFEVNLMELALWCLFLAALLSTVLATIGVGGWPRHT